MALPDFNDKVQGTAIVWGEVLASGVTHPLSLDGLAAGAARMGSFATLGSPFADAYAVYLRAEMNASGNPSGVIDLYLVCSPDATGWAAKVTGSDGAYTGGTGGLALAGEKVTSMTIPTSSSGLTLTQAPVLWEPKGQYVVPIFVNNTNMALKDEASAVNNDSRVILVPIRKTLVE